MLCSDCFVYFVLITDLKKKKQLQSTQEQINEPQWAQIKQIPPVMSKMQITTIVKHQGIHQKVLLMHKLEGKYKPILESYTHLRLRSMWAYQCKQQKDTREILELRTRQLWTMDKPTLQHMHDKMCKDIHM